MPVLLAIFGVIQLLTGALLWLAPGFFYDEIGPYGPRNDHYMADLATWYLALGVVLFVAIRRTAWRVPVLCVLVLQYALHTVNHLIDVSEADPGWLGPADLASLVLTTILLGWMLRTETTAAAR